LLAGVDQLIKLLVLRKFSHLVSVNTGGAFGLASKYPFYNFAVLFIIAVLVFFTFWVNKDLQKRLPLFFIISGALGNLIDRFFRGGAIDYLDLKFWPSFNFADILITLGVIWLLYLVVLVKKKKC